MVTGRCDFIGSNGIRNLLRESGFSGRVIAVDNLTCAGNTENPSDTVSDLWERYTPIEANLCDRTTCPEYSMFGNTLPL